MITASPNVAFTPDMKWIVFRSGMLGPTHVFAVAVDKPNDGARCRSVRAEVLDVHVRAQPDVVGQVPSHVIGIDIDHDLIGVPQPVIAEGEIVLRCLLKLPT